MALPVNIECPRTSVSVEVRGGALLTTSKSAAPTQAEAQRDKLYTALMTDSAGSSDMAVDGSSTSVPYAIRANTDDTENIITLTSLRLVFHSSQMDINSNESRRFGPVAAPGLTNGLTLFSCLDGTETNIFLSPVQVIGDFYRYAGGAGVGINNAIVTDKDAISAGTDFLMVLVVLPAPVALYPGTFDKVEILVQDDLSGLTLFETQAYGTQAAP